MKYDYIIVGAGSAGCVIASRLSDDPGKSILLLEAGPDYPEFEHYPDDLKFGYSQTASAVDAPHNWSFQGNTTPEQPDPMPVPRGRVVGGSSAINGQVLLRGIPEDYDGWAAMGNDQWGFTDVLPYLRKLETDTDIHDDFHGSEGPIPVRRFKEDTWLPAQKAFHAACRAQGHPHDPDMNHPESGGVGPIPMNNPNGIRMSTSLTYLAACRHRLNLTVKPDVVTHRVIFEGKRATGVEVESNGERFMVEGSEIILTCGAIGSPQLLMLSGVGPAAVLNGLGIPVVLEAPGVGQNLRDHPNIRVPVEVLDDFPLNPEDPRTQVAVRYTCILELAYGSGHLKITSTDPNVQPELNYNYFQDDPRDLARLREAVRKCVQVLEHDDYKPIVKRLLEPEPGELESDEALDNWLKRNVTTSQHISGTCKMGPDDDPMAVVDQQCRVKGLEGLRVADASVMPNCIRANTNCTTIMIAERVADWINQA